MPSLRKTAAAVGGAALAALLAYPPSRRQLLRTGRTAFDELALGMESPWSTRLLILTAEGSRSGVPRTVVLASVTVDGQLYVVPWSRHAGWLANVRAHPQVVIDDRVQVRRGKAEVVDGEAAAEVRAAFVEEIVPGPLRDFATRAGSPVGPGVPVVKLTPTRRR